MVLFNDTDPTRRPRMASMILGDTKFGSYSHFALLLRANLHGLMPAHQQRITDFTPGRAYVHPRNVDQDSAGMPRSRWIRSLGRDDQLVEWFRPLQRPDYISSEAYQSLPESIIVRELRRRVKHPALGHWVELTIVTTLLDPDTYAADKLVELRLRRWQAGVDLRHLKTTMGLEVLKCKSVQGVNKELAVFGLVYNLVRVLMLEAAARQETTPDRISFKDVLQWLRAARATDRMPRFVINPRRQDRFEPRVRKRRPKEYDLMTRPRSQLKKALQKQAKGN
jgi:hypothetical protein